MTSSLSWNSVRGVLTGIAVSIPITIVGALFALQLAFAVPAPSLGLPSLLIFLAAIPIACNLFVWRLYMSRSSRAVQVSMLATGVILSVAFAFAVLVGLFLSFMSGG